jgi:biopolymer transport protein ExbD
MKIRGGAKVEPEITPASLPDIAFLLLIFFIATTMFDIERGIPLLLPPKGGERTKVKRENVMIINSDAQDRIYIDDQPVTVDEIADIVRERLAENDKLIISIESHPESHYQTMIDILDEVKKAKAPRISVKMYTG